MNILIINGYERFVGVGEAKLNYFLVDEAKNYFLKRGAAVKITVIEDGYDANAEHDKLLWCDILCIQSPVYWFGIPGLFKSYIDRVLMIGYANGSTLTGDGRAGKDNPKNYGGGGLLTNKKYMMSSTWNAPRDVFNAPELFLEGLDIDQVLMQLHKSYQFLGMQKIPSFAIYDVFHSTDNVERQVVEFTKHLDKYIKF
jgi:modulator of drug activity B